MRRPAQLQCDRCARTEPEPADLDQKQQADRVLTFTVVAWDTESNGWTHLPSLDPLRELHKVDLCFACRAALVAEALKFLGKHGEASRVASSKAKPRRLL